MCEVIASIDSIPPSPPPRQQEDEEMIPIGCVEEVVGSAQSNTVKFDDFRAEVIAKFVNHQINEVKAEKTQQINELQSCLSQQNEELDILRTDLVKANEEISSLNHEIDEMNDRIYSLRQNITMRRSYRVSELRKSGYTWQLEFLLHTVMKLRLPRYYFSNILRRRFAVLQNLNGVERDPRFNRAYKNRVFTCRYVFLYPHN